MNDILCFGEFNESVDFKNCAVCKKNIECFVRTQNRLSCFVDAIKTGSCQKLCNSDRVLCDKVRWILDEMSDLECFGQANQNSDKCLLCERNLKCEIGQLIVENLELNYTVVQNATDRQVREFQSSEDSCFGKYEFDKECTRCDFLIRCRLASQVFPGPRCSNWDKQEFCMSTCSSFPTCDYFRQINTFEQEKEERRTKIYKGFFSLEGIREAVEVGEDEKEQK